MKNLKKFVFDKMETQGFILDNEVAKFLEKEPNYYTIEFYKREYLKLKKGIIHFKEFEENPNTIIRHSNKKYLIRDKIADGFGWYVIPKIYFEYLKNKGVQVV